MNEEQTPPQEDSGTQLSVGPTIAAPAGGDQPKAMPIQRSCDGCTLCCKVLGVDEINKGRNVWCKHVQPDHKGCSIYTSDQYPKACRSYACGYVQDLRFPAWMKPDRVHAVVQSTIGKTGVTIHLDPGYPGAHLDPHGPINRFITMLERAGIRTMVFIGRKVTYKHRTTGQWTEAKTVTDGDVVGATFEDG